MWLPRSGRRRSGKQARSDVGLHATYLFDYRTGGARASRLASQQRAEVESMARGMEFEALESHRRRDAIQRLGDASASSLRDKAQAGGAPS
jgi:hypothetical protein